MHRPKLNAFFKCFITKTYSKASLLFSTLILAVIVFLQFGSHDSINNTSFMCPVQAQTSAYQFLTEFTQNITQSTSSLQELNAWYDTSSLMELERAQENTTDATFTICFSSFTYDHQKNTLSWRFLFDEQVLYSFNITSTTADNITSILYYRVIHSNLLKTRFSQELFIPNSREMILQEYPVSILQNKYGMDLNVDKMLFHLNGSSVFSAFLNISKYLDLPELFEHEYYIQWLTLELNNTQIMNQLLTLYSNNMSALQQHDMYLLLTSSQKKYSFSSLQSFNTSIQVSSIRTSSLPLTNSCGSKSPVIAFAWNSWRLWFVLGMVLLMLVVLVSSIWRPYFVVTLTLVIFHLAGIVSLNDALSGFSNSGTLIVALLFPIVKPLSENSLVLKFSSLLFGSPVRFKNKKNAFLNHVSLMLPTLRIGLVFTVFSAFVSNTPVVATGIPIIMEWAKQHKLSSSKFLMTLLYCTAGGGLLTYIGTSASIVANGIYTQYGYSPLTFYEFVYVGSILAIGTIIYCCFYVLWISPKEGVKPKLNTSKLSSLIGISNMAKKEKPKHKERSEKFISLVKMSNLESQPKRSKAYQLFVTLNGSTKEKILQKLELGKQFELEAILREELRSKDEMEHSAVSLGPHLPNSIDKGNVQSSSLHDPANTDEKMQSSTALEQTTSSDSSSNTNESGSTVVKSNSDSMISPKTTDANEVQASLGISFLRNIAPVAPNEVIQKNDILVFKGLSDSILKLHSMMVDCVSDETKDNVIIGEELTSKCQVFDTKNTESVTNNGSLSVENIEEGRNSQSSCSNVNSCNSMDMLIESPTALTDSHNNEVTNQLYLNLKKKNVEQASEKKSLEVNSLAPTTTTPNTPNTPTTPRKRFSLRFNKGSENKEEGVNANEFEFFEVVVGPSNVCIGENYDTFEKRYQVKVLAIRQVNSSTTLISDESTVKHSEKTTMTKTDHDLTLHTVCIGDTILVLGKTRFYLNHHDSLREFYLISRINNVSPYHDPFSSKRFVWKIPCTHKTLNLWWWEHWIFVFFLAMIACAVAGISMVQCTLVTFCVVILFGLISPTKAVDCIEWRLVAMVGASFGIATAITQSGVAEALTEILRLMNMPLILLPACIVFITLGVTSIITNNAAVAICLPLGLAVARANGLNPRCMAMCVTYAASSVFATPIGYQANLLIMGPGGYTFFDYIKAGLPLTIIYWVIISVFVPLIWGLTTPNF
ncbi:hypothetical protein C9374_001756 [Naegleria lovaniensis]|uniref:Citrate transporter-like domain-containing protein n=1 Tax=Naegleria lovaniensis TaxID=51637 RepID=A0AA88GXD6_NAELO|nr:uncharacterized protein C9374_001756 [Naegleria lovaniensis]KAG2387424.1 hypothetical protein C9374_001756 [Naegleria lovaniensis]